MAGSDPAELRLHYLATDYCVAGAEPFVLKVDVSSQQLLALHRRHQVDCSAFVTACNPRSVLQDAAVNERAQRTLQALLVQRGCSCLPGRAVDPTGQWPDEPSVLALGLPASDAVNLARRFDQNAVLVMAADAVPRLAWVGDSTVP